MDPVQRGILPNSLTAGIASGDIRSGALAVLGGAASSQRVRVRTAAIRLSGDVLDSTSALLRSAGEHSLGFGVAAQLLASCDYGAAQITAALHHGAHLVHAGRVASQHIAAQTQQMRFFAAAHADLVAVHAGEMGYSRGDWSKPSRKQRS